MLNTAPAPLTLVDLLPRWRARTGTLVVAFALLTAAAAQLSFHVPWTPVPITGQTFAVLVAGAVLGRSAGAASQGLYVALGAVGLPFYSGGDGGWEAATGATGGYLIGFVVAAFVTGVPCQGSRDRSKLGLTTRRTDGTTPVEIGGGQGPDRARRVAR